MGIRIRSRAFPDCHTEGTALYWDRYLKVDGRWTIRETSYERIYETSRKLDERPPFGSHYLGTHGAPLASGHDSSSTIQLGKEATSTRYKVALHCSDEAFGVSVPDLPGCWSQGATGEEALRNTQDAIADYLAVVVELLGDAEVREVDAAD